MALIFLFASWLILFFLSGNRKVSNINDLKVKNPTLIKVDNDKVTAYYGGIGEIGDFLNK